MTGVAVQQEQARQSGATGMMSRGEGSGEEPLLRTESGSVCWVKPLDSTLSDLQRSCFLSAQDTVSQAQEHQ